MPGTPAGLRTHTFHLEAKPPDNCVPVCLLAEGLPCLRDRTLLLPALKGRVHFRFRIDAQGISNAIDVVEIGGHFHGVQDVAIRKPLFAHRLNILIAHGGGMAGDEFRELGERFLARRKLGAQIVVLDVFGQFCVTGFDTEILPVSFDSIEAVVGPGNDDGQQLAFGARKS